jgi:hypothetical protein
MDWSSVLNPQSILTGLGQGISGAFGDPATTQNTTSSGSTNFSSSTNPNLSPSAQAFLNQLQSMYSGYLTSNPDLRGYQAQQANTINTNSNLQTQAADQNAAARGLSTSPIAASTDNLINAQRVAQNNSLAQSIPLLQRQLQGQTLAAGNSFFNSIPKGTTTSGNQNTQQQSQTTTQSAGGIGPAISGLLGGLAGFSDEKLKDDIKPLGKSLEIIKKLEPIKFKWKENKLPGRGFSAQQMEKVIPDSVMKGEDGFRRMDMAAIIPHLVNAVKELAEKKVA